MIEMRANGLLHDFINRTRTAEARSEVVSDFLRFKSRPELVDECGVLRNRLGESASETLCDVVRLVTFSSQLILDLLDVGVVESADYLECFFHENTLPRLPKLA